MLRTPFIETLSDLFIRSAQWRGRDELFVDDADRITGAERRSNMRYCRILPSRNAPWWASPIH